MSKQDAELLAVQWVLLAVRLLVHLVLLLLMVLQFQLLAVLLLVLQPGTVVALALLVGE